MKEPNTDQLMATAADLTAWAKEHGPEYLRYAAERGHAVKSGVMDTIAQALAHALGGKVVRYGDRLIQWRERAHPHESSLMRGEGKLALFNDWRRGAPLPAGVEFEPSGVMRVEEQPDATIPDATLKYSGFVVTIRHPATAERFVVVNLEA